MSTRAPLPQPPTVWLGLPGDVIYDEQAETDAYSTRVGGTPCLFAEPSSVSSPSANAAQTPPPHLACGACSQPLPLVAQAYAPTERWPHRSLLVFGCVKPGCGRKPECWRAVRCCGGGGAGVREEALTVAPTEAAPPPPAPAETKDPWAAAVESNNDNDGFGFGGSAAAATDEAGGFGGGGGDEWGAAATMTSSGLNPGGFAQLAAELDTIAAEAEAAKKKQLAATAKQPAPETPSAAATTATTGWRGWPLTANAAAQPTPIPPFHLYAEEEPRAGKRPAVYRKPGGEDQQQEEGGSSNANANDATETDDDGPLAAETYERDAPPPGVAASYVRFGQRLARKPDQCARYVAPASSASASSSSRTAGLLWPLARAPRPQPCPHCRSPRRFELQLMPALIAMALEAGQELGMGGEGGEGGVGGAGDGGDDQAAAAAAAQGTSSSTPSTTVLAGISDWEWCTVAVFTCSADCDGGGRSGKTNNNGASSSSAAASPLLLTEEAVALANEADVHTAPGAGGAGPRGGGGSQQQQQEASEVTTGGAEDDEEDDDEEDGW